MSDDASDFRVKARLDTGDLPGDVDAGVQQFDRLAQSVDGTGEAAGRAEKGIQRMVEEASTVREAQRIAQGFFDVMLGGGRTIEGTAEITRFFIATAADINPAFAALTVLASSLAVVAGRYEEHAEKAQKASEATDHLSRSIGDVRSATEQTKDNLSHAFDVLLEQEKSMEDSSVRQLDLLTKRQEATRKMIEIEKELAIQGERQQYLAGLTPNLTDEERDRRKQTFDAKVKDIQDESTVNTAQLDRDNALQMLAGTQAKVQALEKSVQDLYAAKDKASTDRADALNVLNQIGATRIDKNDESGNVDVYAKNARGNEYNLTQTIAKTIQYQQEYANFIREQLRVGGYMPSDRAGAQAELSDLQGRIDRARSSLREVQNAAVTLQADPNALAKDKLDGPIKDQEAQILKLTDDLEGLRDDLTAKGLALDVARATTMNNRVERSEDIIRTRTKEDAQKDYDDTRGAIEAAIKNIQTDLDSKQLTVDQRQYGQRSIGSLQAQLTKLEEAFRERFHDVTPGQQESAAANEASDIASGNRTARATTDKASGIPDAGQPQYDAASDRLAMLIAQAMKTVAASNNPALKNMLATAPDDQSRGQLFANEYGSSSNAGERGLAKQISDALASQRDAKNLNLNGSQANAYDAAVSKQADLINKIGGIAMAEGFQNLVSATQKVGDSQSKVNEILLAANATHDERLSLLAQQLQAAMAQLAQLKQGVSDLKTRTSVGNSK